MVTKARVWRSMKAGGSVPVTVRSDARGDVVDDEVVVAKGVTVGGYISGW